MRELADFLRFVLPFAAACPDPVAEQHIRAAAREFCEVTRCWRITQCIPVCGDEAEIICVPPFSTLHEIETASFNGEPLERVSFADADVADAGPPRQITQAQPNAISLAPRGRGELQISIFLKPSQDADVLPPFLYEQWGEAIGHGAVARVLSIPDQPYSNPGAAMNFRAMFEQAKDSNFNVSRRGQQRAPVRTRSRFL